MNDCPIHWGSAYKMLIHALKMEAAIETIILQHKHQDLAGFEISARDKRSLKELQAILEPFTKLAALSEADKSPTLPVVVPYYNLLLDTLST